MSVYPVCEKFHHTPYHSIPDNFFDSEKEWLDYELEQLRNYITEYINDGDITATDLYPIKEFGQHLKFQKILDRYDDFYSLDMFGETPEGYKHMNPYFSLRKGKVILNPHYKEDSKILISNASD